MSTYSPAPDVKRIAEGLIPTHHPHLTGIRVEYVYRAEAARSGGKMVWGKARKKSGLDALLATPGFTVSDDLDFFVIEVAADVWGMLSMAQRAALVDHELAHCGCEQTDGGDLKLVILSHDVEEFGSILGRHGLWRPDLTEFMRAVGPEQLELFSAEARRYVAEGRELEPAPPGMVEVQSGTLLQLLPAVDPDTGEIAMEQEPPDDETQAATAEADYDGF